MDGSLTTGCAATSDHLVVEVVRGPVVESRHRVAVAIVDLDGRLVAHHGDPDLAVPPRSSIKSIQALPLVRSGAADAFALDDAELALACSSHNAEPEHLRRVAALLARIGLGEAALECGPAVAHDRSGAAIVGAEPRTLAHTCSGKHAGFLTLAAHLGVDPHGYLDPHHPVQQRVLAAVADVTGVSIGPLGIDGCGAPVVTLPLRRLAAGFASMVDPGAGHAGPASRLRKAMAAEPWFVAGTDRLDTRLDTMLGVNGYVKSGAEGVYGAALVESGLGVAAKVLDGADRAAEVAIVHVLAGLGVVDAADELRRPTIRNAAGVIVGELRVGGF